MHQPTIPEGDEENEGVGQIGEGTRFPHSGLQQPPPIHDTTSTATELQPREEEGPGDEQTPTIESEIIHGTDDVPTDVSQQITPDNQDQIDSKEITSGDQDQIDSKEITEEEKPLEQIDEKQDLSTPREDQQINVLPTDETISIKVPIDEHRRSAKSQKDIPQVEFEKSEQDEIRDVVHEPEIRINREELIARYQAAEIERERLRSINLALQQRLADYLHKRKGTDEIPTLAQAGERSTSDQQQRYQKYLSEIETLQERIKHDQIDFEKRRNDYEEKIHEKKEHVEQLKTEYVKLVKDIASKAIFSRSGKSISNQEVENYLTLLKEKEEDLIKTRHENIRLKNQLKKRELQLKSKEELAEGLHMIDFEQLKIENQTYSEKIEERSEELMKLRKKISTTVQILSHIKEKLNFVNEQRQKAAEILADRENEVKQKRDELSTIKRRRDRLRQENQSLKQNSGLIGNEQLLRDYEERYDDIERCTEKLEHLKKRHAEITLMCKVLKNKISKV